MKKNKKFYKINLKKMQVYIDELDKGVPYDLNMNYQFIKNIAQGAFGTVIQVYDIINKKDLAIKVINKTGRTVNIIHKMKDEVNILKQLKHENIVKYYGFEESNSYLFIIMEFIKYGTLSEYIKKNVGKIKEEEASIIISKILSATEYLHNKLICHRDIKPENIMFSKENDLSSIKLIDFGLSAQNLYNPLIEGYAGTLLYMSPEQIEKKFYCQTVDIWSIGIILYMLLNNGKHPFYFKGNKKKNYIEKIKKGKFKFEKNISYLAKNLIGKLLEINPSWRYSSDKAIRHPWITRKKNDEIPKTFNEILSIRNATKNIKDIYLISLFLNFCQKNKKILNNNSLSDNEKYNILNEDNENENKIFIIDDNYVNKCNYYNEKKKEKLKKEKDFGLEVIEDNINLCRRRSTILGSIIRRSSNANNILKTLKKQNSKKDEKDVKFKLFTNEITNKQNSKINKQNLNKSTICLNKNNKNHSKKTKAKYLSNKKISILIGNEELKSRNSKNLLKKNNNISSGNSKIKSKKVSNNSSIIYEIFPFVNKYNNNSIHQNLITVINEDKISPLILPQIPISNRVVNVFQIGNF